jgi:hypothetical protein
MKLNFPRSKYDELTAMVIANPDAISISVTNQELVAIYSELLENNNSQCIFISGHDKKLFIDSRWIPIKVIS